MADFSFFAVVLCLIAAAFSPVLSGTSSAAENSVLSEDIISQTSAINTGDTLYYSSSTPNIFNYCIWQGEFTTRIGKYNTAPAAKKYAVITLNINNTGDQTYSTNPNYWHLKIGDIYYQYDIATYDDSLHHLTADVGPGGKIIVKMSYLVDRDLSISDMGMYYDGPGSDGIIGSNEGIKPIDGSTPNIFNYCTLQGEFTTQIGKYNTAPASKKYEVVTLNINNNGDQTYSTNPNYWHLKIGDIYYQYDIATYDDSLHHLTAGIGPGGKITVKIAYLVDKDLSISDTGMYYDGPGSDGIIGSTYSLITEKTATSNPLVDFSANTNSGYAPLTVEFKDKSTGSPTSWLWDFGDGTTSTEQNPKHTYSAVGKYTVTLTVNNLAGSNTVTRPGYIDVSAQMLFKTYAYITNSADNSVSVIDTSNNKVAAEVKVGKNPTGVAVTPDGLKVYVANENSNTVSVINTATNKVSATVTVGKYPHGVAVTPDGTKAYVTNYGANIVSVINTVTNKVTAIVTVQKSPWGVAVSPDGTKTYVTCDNSNTVSIIDTASDTVITSVKTENHYPGGVAVTPDGTRIYVTSGGSNTVLVLDTATNSVITTVNVGKVPTGVTITPDGSKVYVANFNNSTVSVIDTATNSVIATMNVGKSPYGLAVNPDGTKVYVANDHSNNVSIIDTVTNTVIAFVNVGKYPKALGKFIGVVPVSSGSVSALPVADFSTSVTSGNAPLFVQFTDNSQNAESWSWNFGDGAVSTEKSPGYAYSSAGIYTATLTVSNAKGTDSSTATINVQDGSSSDGSNNDGSSSGGSSSGGSGGGGGSPEPQSNVEIKELSQTFISSGKTASFDFPQKATAVMSITFDSKKTAGKTTTIAEMLKEKSTLVSGLPSDEIYKFLNIWVGNSGFATSKNIENAVVNFKVEKSWITDKNIDPASIALNWYNDKKWEVIPVSKSGEDSEYLYFTASVSGFSSFAITGRAKSTTEQPAESLPNIGSVQLTNDTNDTVIKGGTEEKTPGFETIQGIICLLGVFIYKRNQR